LNAFPSSGPSFLVASSVRRVTANACVAPLPAFLVAKYRKEENGKSFPFNGHGCLVAGHLFDERGPSVQLDGK